MIGYAWSRRYESLEALSADLDDSFCFPGWYSGKDDSLLITEDDDHQFTVYVFNSPNGKEIVMKAFQRVFMLNDYGSLRMQAIGEIDIPGSG